MSLPRCRLFLVVPDGVAPQTAAACLAAAAEAADVAAVVAVEGGLPEGITQTMLANLRPIAERHDVALIVRGDAGLAKRLGADGAEVSDLAAYRAARKLLGDRMTVGADCGTSRHDAMVLGEAGADYVGFRDLAGRGGDLVQWWAELFVVPCVARDPVGPEDAAELARRGADFVRPADAMWSSPAAARRVVAETAAAIGGAGR